MNLPSTDEALKKYDVISVFCPANYKARCWNARICVKSMQRVPVQYIAKSVHKVKRLSSSFDSANGFHRARNECSVCYASQDEPNVQLKIGIVMGIGRYCWDLNGTL